MIVFNLERPFARIVSRTVVGIDATYSMSSVFNLLITVMQKSLPIIYEVIKEANVAGSF